MAAAPAIILQRGLLAIAILAAVLYLGVLVALFVAQRSALYVPPRVPAVAPAAPIEAVSLKTADGETLTAWYLAPPPGRPIVLFFHGNGGSLQGESARWEAMAKAGLGFFAVTYRGYPGSTGRPTEEGLHEDSLAAYRWVAARYSPQDIVIHGHSLGSGVAVRLASEQPARALVLEAPFISAVDRAAARFPWAPVRLLMLDRYPSRDRIGQVRMPVLIVHGDQDAVIPISDGRTLFSLANEPKAFVQVRGGDHNDLVSRGLYDEVRRFLKLS